MQDIAGHMVQAFSQRQTTRHRCTGIDTEKFVATFERRLEQVYNMASDSVAGASSDQSWASALESAVMQRGRRGRVQRSEVRIYILIGSQEGGLWHEVAEQRPSSRGDGCAAPSVVALALAKIVASPLGTKPLSDLHQHMRDLALAQSRRATVRGFLEYEMQEVFRLLRPVDLANVSESAEVILQVVGQSQGETKNLQDAGASPRLRLAADQVVEWQSLRHPMPPTACAILDRQVLLRLVAGGSAHFHCIAMGSQLNRTRLIAQDDAPRKMLKRLRDELPAAPETAPLRVKRWKGPKGEVMDADMALDWLDCSQDMKSQRMVAASCQKFAAMFSRRSGISKDVLLKNVQITSAKSLIKSRIRADCAALILHRQWWQSVKDRDDVHVYIFCDSSPQWRGVELFACTVDILVGEKLHRRLAPLVSLSKAQLNLNGKVAALLWQLFFLAGPGSDSFRDFCRRVVSVTTDMGTERLLADCRACLARFLATAFPIEPAPADDASDFLFDTAFLMPGFRHLVDNMIQRGLCSLRCFPSWLTKLKSIVSFLRNELVVNEICGSLERDGLSGLAGLIRKSALPSFASWRWGTLAEVAKALGAFLPSLVEHFDVGPFERQRDTTELKNVLAAFGSKAWHRIFWFVAWFAEELTTLMTWIGGCPCHNANALLGKIEPCERKGRRLPEAHGQILQVLGRMSTEANGWGPTNFDDDVDLWREAQGAVRFIVTYGKEKAAFLDKVPYLLARLSQVSVGCLSLVAMGPMDDPWAGSSVKGLHNVCQGWLVRFSASLELQTCLSTLGLLPESGTDDEGVSEPRAAQDKRFWANE